MTPGHSTASATLTWCPWMRCEIQHTTPLYFKSPKSWITFNFVPFVFRCMTSDCDTIGRNMCSKRPAVEVGECLVRSLIFVGNL